MDRARELDDFRRDGHRLIDAIADYLETIDARPVRSSRAPGETAALLPPLPPEAGEPFDRVLEDVRRVVVPGLTHWQHPRFFGYFPANASPPAILGELLSAGLGVQGMLWSTSPACTEIETRMLDWLHAALALPDCFRSDAVDADGRRGGAVIQDTASSSTLCALLAARDRATGWETSRGGVARRMTAYASAQAHSSFEKAMAVAGLGRENLRQIEVDERLAMRPEALAAAVTRDLRDGCLPFFCGATVGTTSSGAIDPVGPIAEIAAAHRLWLHVDAAWAGVAAICPEFRGMHAGIERADSYCVNPHKWLLVNFDCDALYVRDRDALVRTLGVLPEYLRNRASESGAVIDYRDWQIPLGRRFRALKLWFTMRRYGLDGLRAHVRRGVAMAQWLEARVKESKRLELAAERSLALLCLRHCDGDEATQRLLDSVNDSGEAFLTHTRLHDRLVVRVAIGGTWTQESDVRRLWSLLDAAAG